MVVTFYVSFFGRNASSDDFSPSMQLGGSVNGHLLGDQLLQRQKLIIQLDVIGVSGKG
jgi:hypothetical protein